MKDMFTFRRIVILWILILFLGMVIAYQNQQKITELKQQQIAQEKHDQQAADLHKQAVLQKGFLKNQLLIKSVVLDYSKNNFSSHYGFEDRMLIADLQSQLIKSGAKYSPEGLLFKVVPFRNWQIIDGCNIYASIVVQSEGGDKLFSSTKMVSREEVGGKCTFEWYSKLLAEKVVIDFVEQNDAQSR